MKLCLLYCLFLFIAARVLSCKTPEPSIVPITYDYNVYVRLIDNRIEFTVKDSAEYIMDLEDKYCGGVDTVLMNGWGRIKRFHNADSCGHTKHI